MQPACTPVVYLSLRDAARWYKAEWSLDMSRLRALPRPRLRTPARNQPVVTLRFILYVRSCTGDVGPGDYTTL